MLYHFSSAFFFFYFKYSRGDDFNSKNKSTANGMAVARNILSNFSNQKLTQIIIFFLFFRPNYHQLLLIFGHKCFHIANCLSEKKKKQKIKNTEKRNMLPTWTKLYFKRKICFLFSLGVAVCCVSAMLEFYFVHRAALSLDILAIEKKKD